MVWVGVRASPPGLPDQAPDSRFFHPDDVIWSSYASWFLVFSRNMPLIHPESPDHPRPPGVRSGTPNERKTGTDLLYRRENTRTQPLSRRKSPSPLVALSPPAPPLANLSAGCLHSAVPPPASLYSAVRLAVCLYSAVGQLLTSRLIDHAR
jgi:hypothetical protein